MAQIGKNPESGVLEHLFPTLAQARDACDSTLLSMSLGPGPGSPMSAGPWDTAVGIDCTGEDVRSSRFLTPSTLLPTTGPLRPGSASSHPGCGRSWSPLRRAWKEILVHPPGVGLQGFLKSAGVRASAGTSQLQAAQDTRLPSPPPVTAAAFGMALG